MKRSQWALPVAISLAFVGVRAYAVWRSEQISPKNATSGDRVFTVTSKNVENYKQVEITVAAQTGKYLPPFLRGSVLLANDQVSVGVIPVEEERKGDKVLYRFRVAPTFLSRSRFDYDEQGYMQVRGPGNKSHYEMTLGGSNYWFSLRDFVQP